MVVAYARGMTRRYVKNVQTAGRIIDGLAFVVTPGDNKLHTLNASATLIWHLAATGTTAEEAAAAMCERFEVDLEMARGDIEACLADLVAREILVARESGESGERGASSESGESGGSSESGEPGGSGESGGSSEPAESGESSEAE